MTVNFAINLAQIYAWTGEKDLAIEQIEMVLRFPNPLSTVTQTSSALGFAPRQSALRKNRRLARTEIGLAGCSRPFGRGVASHCDTQSPIAAPVTFFAMRRKVSGRNGKQPHNERKLNNMKTKIQRTTPMKQIFLYTSLAVMALAVTTTGAAPERCDGTVQLTSQSNFQDAASRQANVRPVRLHRPARHLPGRPLGRDRHRRRPPGPAHFGQR